MYERQYWGRGGGGYQVAGRLVVRNNENQTFVR